MQNISSTQFNYLLSQNPDIDPNTLNNYLRNAGYITVGNLASKPNIQTAPLPTNSTSPEMAPLPQSPGVASPPDLSSLQQPEQEGVKGIGSVLKGIIKGIDKIPGNVMGALEKAIPGKTVEYSPNHKGAVSSPEQFKEIIEKSAKDHNIPADLLTALINQESRFNPNAISPAGAMGIAQFMPGTAKEYGINPYDPAQAIPAAAQYLRKGYDKYKNWDKALAAYNAGFGAVDKYGGIPPFKETQGYVSGIMSHVDSSKWEDF